MQEEQNYSRADAPNPEDSGFGMFKRIIASMPFGKPLAVVIDFFESCGISMKQLQNLASGKAQGEDLNKVITPIVYKTIPALQAALEHLEAEQADGHTGGAFMLVRNVKSRTDRITPYVFLCTLNEEGQNVIFDQFPFIKAPAYILNALEKKKLTSASQGPTPALAPHQDDEQ